MASPQKENGYVPIANELYEALCRTRINGEARQVLDVVIRKTYGFQKKSDCIALSQFVLYTGLSKIAVRKALNKLLALNLVTQKGNDVAKEYAVIKDYSLWKPLPKKVTLPKKVINRTQKGNKSYPKSAPQKKENNITKDIASQSDAALIAEFISLFEGVNPSYRKWYGNITQRGACNRLLVTHGLEQVQKVVALLPKTNGMAYFPTITTPIQLEDKWAQLAAALTKKKNETLTRGRGLA